ncbi:N-acylglucosamine 2-epimerase [Pseudopedobacter saltans DSM 12145]|uniref:N-acylglucosamine 2-epimerase n=1 Tax=Pseudopedobacter saltans (strain ATCC 51119 / DSM 12145 / JCM 21818 / CCUG 39354 / LMG 10337 / NBRC 100064 / NCIMB 13643) TaxID=762903 RepID=F0SC30_PSESL|nr:AGE family epimerase/isomerase [Pseudopedobacter saltans]ADY50615.1 N-acylglucosamine 2-epimerase [Pseudopedobacter saltans DSM 12145]
MNQYSEIYRKELLDNIMPFWTKHSMDKQNGGYFTCLDRFGNVFDTDKFMWLQGRGVWTYATLYDKLEAKKEWLEIAIHGAEFMKKHGRDAEGNWYFSLNREGKPLVQPYNIFSDCFATMGFGALYTATQKEEYGAIAKATFENILKRRTNTKGQYSKIYPGTRDLRNFSLPMILSNLSIEIEHLLDKNLVEELINDVINEVMNVFYQEEHGIIFENVNQDGSFSDSFEGRLLNPGHTIEAMWFMMDLGVRLSKPELINKALEIALNALDYGWDKEHGGIFYFLDFKGYPPQQLEWDQKLWWVHVEALVCMAKAWTLTGNEKAKVWFEKLHDYTWTHFKDKEYGEWFGYLNRQGEVLLNLKGGKWKGCFHVPRALFQVYKTLESKKSLELV